MTTGPTLKEGVRTYWQRSPCGEKTAEAETGTPEFFAQVEWRRRELEPFIDRFADFDGAGGKDLLEIGVGLGTDFVRFARAGANVTGVDLTQRSIELVQARLAQEGLSGNLQVADAESLPFDADSFDRVYSWGVLHHTPDTRRAIEEVRRVLRPGGQACIMLYGKRSWVAYGLWIRYAALIGRPWRSLDEVIAGHMESDGTKAYTPAELQSMFASFGNVTIEQVSTPYDRRVVGPLATATERWLGWFVVIRARVPARLTAPGSAGARRDVLTGDPVVEP